jgi:pyruvate,water dikinase
MIESNADSEQEGSYVIWLAESKPFPPVSTIGNKAAGILKLLNLRHFGFEVPESFVITTKTYNKIFRLQADVFEKLLRSKGSLQKKADEIQKQFMYRKFGLHDFILDEVAPAYERLCEAYGIENIGVAVRSSAIFEDQKAKSYAGSYETYLNVKGTKSLVDHVLLCFASAWKKSLLTTYEKNKVVNDVSIALLVQRIICADTAGVVFTSDPISNDPSKICINSAWGLGDAVVSGRINADIFRFNKKTMHVDYTYIGDKTAASRCSSTEGTYIEPLPPEMALVPSLNRENAARLARICLNVENELGFPVDIEWAYLNDKLYLLQVRPITTI